MAGSAELAIIITAKDQASGVLDGIKGKAGGLGNSFKALGIAALGGLGVAAVAAKAVIGPASNLAESMSKVEVVFGENAAAVKEWAKTSAISFGQSKQSALEAAGTFGNLFQAFGLGRQESTDMSKNLTELAADLASFNNTSVDEALIALRSGLSGEAEPLKRYGVAINEARLKTEALSLGLISSTKDALSPAAKAQASYALILKDTALAQGDFDRTSGGLANQQRILGAQFENLKATIGTALLPAITAGTKALNEFLTAHMDDIERFTDAFANKLGGAIQGVMDFLQQHKETINGFFEAFKRGLETMKPIFEFIINNKPVLVAAIAAIGIAILVALGPGAAAVIAIVGLIALIGYLRDNWRDVLDAIKGYLTVFTNWIKDHWLPILIGILGGPVALAIYVFRDDIKGAIDEIVLFFEGLPKRIVDGIGDITSLLFNKGKDLIQGFIDGIKSLPVPNPLDLVPGGGLIKKGAGLLGFAGGGIVPGPMGAPQLAVVHGGEQVLTPEQQGGGGAGVTNVFNIYADMSDSAVQRLAAKVNEATSTALRRTGLQGSFSGASVFTP